MVQTVKQFVDDAYQLVSANSPTVPLHGNDQSKGIQFLNELIQAYSGNSLMLTIAKEVVTTVAIGQRFVTFADAGFLPTPDVAEGRLSNFQNAWLLLDGVTYPLIDQSRNAFYASYKYDPLMGLPRFAIITNNVDFTTMQIYPSPSQEYQLHVYGKFQLPVITINGDMSSLPLYYARYLKFALAKELAMYKGRARAWTQDLEVMYREAKDDMKSASAINLVVETNRESLLNGSWRVRAGI